MTITESTPTGPNPEGQDQYATETTFASLGVCAPLVAALDRQGIVKAFPIQALTVRDALAGRDVCGKARRDQARPWALEFPLSSAPGNHWVAPRASFARSKADQRVRVHWFCYPPANSACRLLKY
ncbi:MAG: hypothetical protein NT160_09160 [Actinobacteria bacterium]|nr:hypothetical protein [Actinomycetota bacterium]